MSAYYNEFDPFAAQWLRNLIAEGLIAPGEVDERSIKDVKADDLRGFTQCHFFAGIGGWSYALRLAEWPDDQSVWTGSCPCQPFSAAGKRKGTTDERHLWPEFRRLIGECEPSIVFGEQVASKDGRLWLTGVRADLEALGYAIGAADLCAAGAGEKAKGRISFEDNSFRWEQVVIGAPHIRQRLYWMADANQRQRGRITTSEGCDRDRQKTGWQQSNSIAECGCAARGLADTNGRSESDGDVQRSWQYGQLAQDGSALSERLAFAERDAGEQGRSSNQSRERAETPCKRASTEFGRRGDSGWMGNTNGDRRQGAVGKRSVARTKGEQGAATERSSRLAWSDAIWLPCIDGKARRIEPGSFPLAHGVPARMGRLRGYGNAIVPQVAAEFIRAAQEARLDILMS